jgi:hypothetical protein
VIRENCDRAAFLGAELAVQNMKLDHAKELEAEAAFTNKMVTETRDAAMILKDKLDDVACANISLQDELAYAQGKHPRKDREMVRARIGCFDRALRRERGR